MSTPLNHSRQTARWPQAYMASLKFRDGGREAPYVDCFGLVKLVLQNECGIVLPDWPELVLANLTASGTSLLEERFTSGFTPVQTGLESAFDVALIRRLLTVDGTWKCGWWHAGVVSEPGIILHMDPAQGIVEQPFRDTPKARASATLRARDVRLFRHMSRWAGDALEEAAA